MISLSSFSSSSSAESLDFFQAKPGCNPKCGNVTIPYPFGIGDGCSMSDKDEFGNTGSASYRVICNSTFNPPKPFINANGGKLEVLSISGTEVRIRNSFTEFICVDKSGKIMLSGPEYGTLYDNLNLNNTPFTVSNTRNNLFGIGCGITDVASYTVDPLEDYNSDLRIEEERECESSCEIKEHMTNTFCNSSTGYSCCETSIPKGLKRYKGGIPWYIDRHFEPRNNSCTFVLLAEEGQYSFNLWDLTMDGFLSKYKNSVIPVVLDWAVGSNTTCEQAHQNLKAYACQVNSDCSDTIQIRGKLGTVTNLGYQCTCKKGFEGNPYLEPGCKDINECEIKYRNPCVGNCTNTIGSYNCSCPVSMSGDGKKDGLGCSTTVGKAGFPLMRVLLGTGFGFSIFILGAFLLYLSLRKRRLLKLKQKFFKQNGGLSLTQHLSSTGNGTESTRIFTSEELQLATNKFNESEVLGHGGHGIVYRGTLSDSHVVAIKKSKVYDQSQVEQFINEVVILTQINHRNVVKLLGCCLETEVPLLVYEYVPCGTLFQHIHHKEGSTKASSMTWESRLRIATEIASAIAYLHSAASPPIIHRDIKSTNILLDENFTAKVSDFGASRLIPLDQTRVYTLVHGSLGYLDPEYFNTSQLTDKSDVYSFGVVLAELLTGEMPICFEKPEEQRNLAAHFTSSKEGNNVFQLIDAKVAADGKHEEVFKVAEITWRCLSLKGEDRPTMKQIAADLQVLLRLESFETNHQPSQHNVGSNLPSEPTDLYSVPMSTSIEDSSEYSGGTSMTLTPSLLLIISISSFSFLAESLDIIQSKRGCQSECGNVTIPYPFGIGNGCSLIDSSSIVYTIICDTQYSPPKPFINANGDMLEVLSISDTEVRIKNSFTKTYCNVSKNDDDTLLDSAPYGGLNLDNTPFAVSYTNNNLFGIGCDVSEVEFWSTDSFDSASSSMSRQCESSCEIKENTIKTSCNGIGYICCEVPIPKGLKMFIARAHAIYATANSIFFSVYFPNTCTIALLAELGHYAFHPLDLTMGGFNSTYKNSIIPVVLDWAVGSNTTCKEAQQINETYVCQENSYCSDTLKNPNPGEEAILISNLGYRCICNEGFEGNPYLEPGCKDINECERKNNNPCVGNCTNTIGSYICSCPIGMSGDGKKDGLGCSTPAGKAKSPVTRVALGIGFGFLIFILGAFLLYLSIRKQKQYKLKEKFFKQNGGLLLTQQLSSIENGTESTRIFTSEELELATNKFNESEVLGRGGYGVVYKGTLSDNRVVAIKMSKVFDQSQVEQFVNEVVILAQINHINVVKLLGCCLETEVPLLVYEYISSGTLFERLHYKQNSAVMSSMTWETRLRIATDVATAIAYLHSAASPAIIHRDIKSANILLDENFTAKVSDFGASRLIPLDHTHVNTLVYGTLGYLDPEYYYTSQLTDKSDVYSFGVVVAELLTAEIPLCLERPEAQRTLATYFTSCMEGNDAFQLIDASILTDGKLEEIFAVAEIAKKCLSLRGEDRPTMKQIAADLQVLQRSESSGSNHQHGRHQQNGKSNLPSEPTDLYSVPLKSVDEPTDLYTTPMSSVDDHSSQYSAPTSMTLSMNIPR
ncbi:hypothetical protein MKX01_031116 [Papaver californicum]|nr:hypothetical protein MKX01_031116 [Papaver californicum]